MEKKSGLTEKQQLLLNVIHDLKPISATQILNRFRRSFSRSTVYDNIAYFKKRGWVKEVKRGSIDKRHRYYKLSFGGVMRLYLAGFR